MSTVAAPRRRSPRAAATRGRRAPFRRIVGDFLANPVAVFGLALLALIVVARALRAADLAAESLRPRAARRDGQQAAAGLDSRRPAARSGSAPTTRAATCCRRSSTACASRSVVGVGEHGARARHRARRSGLTAAYFGGRRRDAHHAHRRHPALVPGDPDRADPDRGAGAGHGQGHRRAGHRAVGVLRAHGAQRGAGREAQGIHRGGALPRAVAGAHRVPPPAAQLPAADDRRRHGAGRRARSRSRRRCRSSASACRSPSRRSAC